MNLLDWAIVIIGLLGLVCIAAVVIPLIRYGPNPGSCPEAQRFAKRLAEIDKEPPPPPDYRVHEDE